MTPCWKLPPIQCMDSIKLNLLWHSITLILPFLRHALIWILLTTGTLLEPFGFLRAIMILFRGFSSNVGRFVAWIVARPFAIVVDFCVKIFFICKLILNQNWIDKHVWLKYLCSITYFHDSYWFGNISCILRLNLHFKVHISQNIKCHKFNIGYPSCLWNEHFEEWGTIIPVLFAWWPWTFVQSCCCSFCVRWCCCFDVKGTRSTFNGTWMKTMHYNKDSLKQSCNNIINNKIMTVTY